jgi:hypothetical protein
MRAADRGMSPHDVEAALTSFDRISTGTAKRVIDYYVTRYKTGDEATKPRFPAVAAIAAVA